MTYEMRTLSDAEIDDVAGGLGPVGIVVLVTAVGYGAYKLGQKNGRAEAVKTMPIIVPGTDADGQIIDDKGNNGQGGENGGGDVDGGDNSGNGGGGDNGGD
ncbi:MAG: class IIb bacteriocin, lactobin A/cerein 7B family [Pseudomonadota bacterium]